MHKISVIMGIFNCAPYLDEAIQSIINQTYENWEMILCDDGSTDNTYLIASKYATEESRIRLIKNEKNLGLSKTLNRCLAIATGDYIARMDGDDISLPQRFEKEVAFLDSHPEFAVVSCPMIYFDENGEYKRAKAGRLPTAQSFPRGEAIAHAPCMGWKKAFDDVGGYSEAEDRLRVEDMDLWLRMFAKGYRMCSLTECLYKMRDDRKAFARRKYKYRINAARVRASAVKMLHLSPFYYIYCLRPLLVGLLPRSVYMFLHRKQG